MSQIVSLSLLVGFLCVLLPSLKMPHPYEGLRTVPVSEEKLANVPPFPPDFATGAIRLNNLLEKATRVFEGKVFGAEHVDTSPDGTQLYLLDRYGYMHIAAISDGVPRDLKMNVTYVGPGRPLGFVVTEDSVLVACSLKGLLRITWTESGKGEKLRRTYFKEILANQGPDGLPIHYANAVALHPSSGDVYFTSSTQRPVSLSSDGYYDTLRGSILNAMRGDASGRVLKYCNTTGKVSLVAADLWFPNGIAVSPDGQYLYVVETFGYRVLRVSLKTNHQTVLVGHLPAHPDGISIAPNGNLWVSLVSPLSVLTMSFPYPMLRGVLAQFIYFVTMLVKQNGMVVQVSPEGEVLTTLADPSGSTVYSVSSAHQKGDMLYLGCLSGDYVSYYRLAQT